jgi:PAS domain S-box-containing protein
VPTKKPGQAAKTRRTNSTAKPTRTVKPRRAKTAQKSIPATSAKRTTRERERKIQAALYEIAATASSIQNMGEFYAAMHRIVGELMYAENFFIALYDEQTGLITWPYYVDTVDVEPHSPTRLPDHHGATGWVLRHGKTIADVDGSWAAAQARGEGQNVGSESVGIASPLKVNHDTLGVVFVQSYIGGIDYQPEDVQVLDFVAQHIATALTRARAIEETRQRNAELEIINSVQQGLASNLDFQAIIDLVGDKLQAIFDAQVVSIATCDRATDLLYNWYTIEKGQRVSGAGARTSRSYGFRQHVIETREPLVINHDMDRLMEEYHNPVVVGAPVKSAVFVPMLAGDHVSGVISLQNIDRENAFSDPDVRLLQTLANAMSVALENARLFDETQRLLKETEQRNAELAIINSVQAGLAQKLDFQEIIDLVGGKIEKIFNADTVSVGMYDAERDRVFHTYYADRGQLMRLPAGPAPRPSLTAVTVDTRRPLLIGTSEEGIRLGAVRISRAGEQEDQNEAFLGVPILAGEKVIGAASVQSYRPNAFNHDDLRLLQTLANSLSIALENARLFDETQRLLKETEQRAAELQIINSVQEGLASKLDMQAIYDLVGDKIREIFKADTTFIAFHDAARNLITVVYYADREKRYLFSRPYGAGLYEVIIESGKPLLLNTTQEQEAAGAFHVVSPDSDQDLNQSFLGVPIFRNGTAIGASSVQSYQEHAFDQNDLRLLATLTSSMTVALENARLFDETQRLLKETEQRAAELAAINTVSEALVAEPELDSMIQLIGDQARHIFKADIVYVALLDRSSNLINFPYQVGEEFTPLKLGEGLTSKIIEAGQPLLINRDIDERRAQLGATLVGKQARSYLGVPIMAGKEAIGVLSVQSVTEENVFTENDVRLLSTIAANAGTALRNASLFKEVRRQKQYLEAVIANSPAAIVLTDRNNNVTGWNPAAERLFGYAEAEAMGHHIHDLVANDPELRDELAKVQEGLKEDQANVIAQRSRKDGTLVDVEVLSLPISPENLEQGYITIYHDITELQRARQEAISANEAKSSFLATMSHEIRTPMNAVIGMSGLLLDTPLNPEQREFAEIIRSSGDTLLTIINDILDFSKIEAGKMEIEEQPFDLREAVESALDLIKLRTAEKSVELAYEMYAAVPPVIVGDVNRLRQILLNLLSNAVKFTERGEIELTVGLLPPDRAVHGKQLIHFALRDTGIGIPPDRIDRLFQSFSQVDASTSRKYGGTGLGLVISRRLSEIMGGTLWVESEVGAGSTFHFTILAEAAPGLKPHAQLEAAPAQLSGKRLLIVDDNETNRRILRLQVRAWGIVARDTASPQTALEWIRRGDPCDLVITDLQMPGMDGMALAAAIRQLRDAQSLPLVLYSSLGGREAGVTPGLFEAMLMKPLHPSLLLDTLMTIFGSAARQVANPIVQAALEVDPEMAARRPLRILLAEDIVVNQKLALRYLDKLGYRADVAANGREAIAALERQPYDAILMDVQMPEMDGLEASRHICARWPREQRPAIIAMTANAMQGDREMCLAAGMDDYLSKPIRIEALMAALLKVQPIRMR